MLDARRRAELFDQMTHAGAFHDEGDEARLRNHLLHRAARDHVAVENIDDAVAAFGFVHVMRADEHGEAGFAQRVDLFPEIATGLRIDAGGGFVEQKESRFVQHAGGEREALLPAARELARELPLALDESQPFQRLADRLRPSGIVDARHEVEIFADGHVFPEAELLGHVTDAALDLFGLGRDVGAEAGAVSGIGAEQTAEHADGRGLARAVGPEKSPHFACGTAMSMPLTAVLPPKRLVRPFTSMASASAHGASGRTSTG